MWPSFSLISLSAFSAFMCGFSVRVILTGAERHDFLEIKLPSHLEKKGVDTSSFQKTCATAPFSIRSVVLFLVVGVKRPDAIVSVRFFFAWPVKRLCHWFLFFENGLRSEIGTSPAAQ